MIRQLFIVISVFTFTIACSEKEDSSFSSSSEVKIDPRTGNPIAPGTIDIGASAQATPDLLNCSKKAVTAGWGAKAQELADCGKVAKELQYVLCYDDKKVDLECLPYRTGLNLNKLSAYDKNKASFDVLQASIAATLNVADHNACLALATRANASVAGFLCIRLANK